MANLVGQCPAEQFGIVDAASTSDGPHLFMKDGRHLTRQRDRIDDRNSKLQIHLTRSRAQLKRASSEDSARGDGRHDAHDQVARVVCLLAPSLRTDARAIAPFD